MMISRFTAMLLVAGLGLTGCTTDGQMAADATPAGKAAFGRATMQDAQGRTVGTAQFSDSTTGVSVRASFTGQPGTYALHLHQTGVCTAPGFTSAGGHLNPTARQHGLNNPNGHHVGDMPNVTIGADGRGSFAYLIEGATADALRDSDGTAIVLHAQPDDMVSDPAGNAGNRIACGVVMPV